jgi:hypothetical protein
LFNESAREKYQDKIYGTIRSLLVSDGVEEFIGPLQITSLNVRNDSMTIEKLLVEHRRKGCPKSVP